MLFLILALSSFLISWLVVALMKQHFYFYLLDIPNDRSSHTDPIPRAGGLGFIIAFAISSGLAELTVGQTQAIGGGMAAALPSNFFQLYHNQPNLRFLWLILIPLIIVGLIDDQRGVPARIRYLVQLVSASLAVACFGPFAQPWLTDRGSIGTWIAIAFSAIAITTLINFYNFMDGLDGLVAGVAIVQFSFLALWFHQPLLGFLVFALLGFLYWNWSPAKIFMGDVGSTSLGAIVAIAFLQNSSDVSRVASALPIILPIIMDATYTLICRLCRRENIFKAHRHHLYQRLQQVGWSHSQVAITYIGETLLIGISIETFGPTGIWISLGGVGLSIIICELYLQHLSHSL